MLKIAAALLFASPSAYASVDGVFFDPAFAGEGWTFESQNDRVGATWYTYESNGQPTFRTLVGTVTAAADSSGRDLTYQMSGQVFRTESRTNTTQVGTFVANFRTVGTEQIGTITAAGATRSLRRFDFAFGSPLDKIRGIWAISTLAADRSSSAVAITFKSSLDAITVGGTPTQGRRFVTYDGFPGIVFVSSTGYFQVQAAIAQGTLVAEFAGGDEGGLGIVALFSGGNRISDFEGFIASDLANTEGEVGPLRQLLQAAGLAPPAPPPAESPKYGDQVEFIEYKLR